MANVNVQEDANEKRALLMLDGDERDEFSEPTDEEIARAVQLTRSAKRKQNSRRVLAALTSPFVGFWEFLDKGNFVQLSVAFVVGTAFNGAVRSFIDDIVMPPVGLWLGSATLTNLFAILKGGVKYGSAYNHTYTTLAQAQDDGAVTENYGRFVLSLFNLLITALVMFLLIKGATGAATRAKMLKQRLLLDSQQLPALEEEKECPHCCFKINKRATRCGFCTSDLQQQ